MEIIIKPIESIWKIMGNQSYENHTKYRPITYCKNLKVDNGWIVYHSITREMVFLTLEEYQAFLSGNNERMVKHWFLVPDEVDDISLLYMFFRAYEARYPRRKYGKLRLCTIVTTTKCNARCPYCYQKGIQGKTMSEETALDVAKFIEPRAGEMITLSWFGGEPLCNQRAIDVICGYLNSKNIEFRSTMITNGYLLRGIPIEKIRDEWKMKQIQITLDGTEEIYNNTKRYVCPGESPFQIVTNNIEHLLREDIFVNIRLNLSPENIDDMFSLVSWIAKRYPGSKHLNVYSRVLFDDSISLSESERKDLYSRQIELQDYIKSKDIGFRYTKPPGIKRCHCMADDGRSVVINTDGNLSLCEHFIDSESYGSIYGRPVNRDVLNRFMERQNLVTECKSCFYRPQCIRLKMCLPEGMCDEENRMLINHRTETMMKDIYRRWIDGKNL